MNDAFSFIKRALTLPFYTGMVASIPSLYIAEMLQVSVDFFPLYRKVRILSSVFRMPYEVFEHLYDWGER